MASSFIRQFILGSGFGLLVACGGKPADPPAAAVAAPEVGQMEIVDLQTGTGPAIAAGQKAVVEYTGWLYEASAADHKGKQFDSSKNGGQPFRFSVGTGQVIKGWDQGVPGMKVGGETTSHHPGRHGLRRCRCRQRDSPGGDTDIRCRSRRHRVSLGCR